MITASALRSHCGYARILSKMRTPTPAQQVSIDKGVQFHAAVEQWARSRELPVLPDLEMQGWLDLLACDWEPPVGAEIEVAWGLRSVLDAGVPPAYVHVDEPEPHVYVARDGRQLLTAGRADVAWVDGEVSLRAADWKTGKWPATPAVDNLQVNAAGIALALKSGLTSYTPGVYYARDGYWDWGPKVVFGTSAFERIWGEIRSAALLDERPRPGEHCVKCWERRGCQHAHSPGS